MLDIEIFCHAGMHKDIYRHNWFPFSLVTLAIEGSEWFSSLQFLPHWSLENKYEEHYDSSAAVEDTQNSEEGFQSRLTNFFCFVISMYRVVNAFENPRQTHRYGHLDIEELKEVFNIKIGIDWGILKIPFALLFVPPLSWFPTVTLLQEVGCRGTRQC